MPQSFKSNLAEKAVLLGLLAALITAGGCGRTAASPDAGRQLEASFAKAEAPLKEEVARVNAALEVRNYELAVATMNRVVQNRAVDVAQKKAVDALVMQVQQATAQDPKIATPQLYKAMSDLVYRMHGEP